MGYTIQRRRDIFARTDGNCHLCHGSLVFGAYGDRTHPGGWEVEHSVPKAHGGTDRLNNLYAAHIGCNRRKRTNTTRSERAKFGQTRAPRSRAKKQEIREDNTLKGAVMGGATGAMLGGPVGAIIGTFFGGLVGDSVEVEK